MDKFKIIYFGTPEIGAEILKTLIAMPEVEVVLVVSQPDKIFGRKKELRITPVKKIALENNIPIIQPPKIGEEYETLKVLKPDFLLTCAYGQFIPTKILELPKFEALNIHGSLLPKYRGGAPIQYAIWNGETKTGVSIMRMVKKMDAGPYFSQKEILIDSQDTSGDLFKKMALVGSQLLKESLKLISTKQLQPVTQDETKVSFSKNIMAEEEKINWSQSATKIYNQIRAFNPNPIAYTTLNNERYKIYKARLITSQEHLPITMMVHPVGQILYVDKEGIVVQTGLGMLKILELQKQGKTRTSAGVFWLNNLEKGGRFE